jgi:two-component system, sensor histidine kinase and response regulator
MNNSLIKILVVDDDEDDYVLMRGLLSQIQGTSFETEWVATYEAAIQAIEHNRHDIYLLDYYLGAHNGLELLGEALRKGCTGPLILVTGQADHAVDLEGMKLGAADYLTKGRIDAPLLERSLRYALERSRTLQALQRAHNELSTANARLVQEIAERKQTEEALRKTNNDKAKLLSIISHDLRGPFLPLLGNLQLILRDIEQLTQTEIVAMTRSMYRSATAVYNLLDNLLTWSRVQQEGIEYRPDSVELSNLAEKTVNLLTEVAHSKKIRLEHTIEAGLFVQADPYMIDTVIRNLTSNALKFTPAGGQVILSAQHTGLSPDKAKPKWVEVGVIDTGVGISQTDIDKLFRLDVPHTTQGTAHETGTGLGLILCQEMVAKNGGQIWIESEEKKGTIVRFTLPAIP